MNSCIVLWITYFLQRKILCCFANLCSCLCRLIRGTIFFYLYIVNNILQIYMMYKCFWLIDENWWKDDNEPFWTNESWGNALMAWVLWIFIYPYLCLLIYIYLPMLICVCCILGASGQMSTFCNAFRLGMRSNYNMYGVFLYHWFDGRPGLAMYQTYRYWKFIQVPENMLTVLDNN